MNYVVLLADNDSEFLRTWTSSLDNAGYEVKSAATPEEARHILQDSAVDLAVLDVRLKDDKSDDDFSGLELAADRAFRHIPKIMLTKPKNVSFEVLSNALGLKADEVPPALACVDKADGPEKLVKVIRSTLDSWPKIRVSTGKISEQTKDDYDVARDQAKLNYRVAQAVSVVGFLVIFAGICLAWSGKITIGIVGTTTGLITEALSYLFFKRVDLANSRMDEYHRELLESYWLELLIGTCQQLPAGKRITGTERVLQAAIDRWITAASTIQASPKHKKRTTPKIQG